MWKSLIKPSSPQNKLAPKHFSGENPDMGMENYSRYQQGVIKAYYDNRDNVSFQRVQELLTDLYLSEGKKQEKVWDSIFSHLEKLSVPADQIEHLRKQKKPELIAQFIQKRV